MTSLKDVLNWLPAVVSAPRSMARSTSSGSAMSLTMYWGNLEWYRILGFCEPFFQTRPMCTASTLCMGIKGDTWPHSDGGQLALGSGKVACAEAPGRGPMESHASPQEPAATYAI